MLLSKTQEDIKNSILEFILDDNPKTSKFLRWNAIAGAGKTSTLKEMYKDYKEINSINNSLNQYLKIRDKLFFTATTNPAATLLNTIGCRNISTIHKFLNLKVMRGNNGTQYLYQVNQPKYSKDTIVIIDEASMVCDVTYEAIINSPYHYILIGDNQQFLAVNNNTEDVFKFYKEKELTSTETFRFEDPALSSYVRVLKQNVMDRKIEYIPNKIGDSLWIIDDDVYFNTLRDAYQYNSDDCLTITFSNKQVSKYETHIKNILGQTHKVKTGDKLIFKSPIRQHMGYRIDPKGGKNLTEIEVIKQASSPIVGNLLDQANIDYLIVRSREKTHKIYRECYLVEDYQELSSVLRRYARKKSWNEYYDIKNNVTVPNYGYASTAHGSQGMTIPYVFLDLTDIAHMTHLVGKDTINRMIYVAISRASKNVFVRGNIPQSLIGNY